MKAYIGLQIEIIYVVPETDYKQCYKKDLEIVIL